MTWIELASGFWRTVEEQDGKPNAWIFRVDDGYHLKLRTVLDAQEYTSLEEAKDAAARVGVS
jgi:hypothetical protein